MQSLETLERALREQIARVELIAEIDITPELTEQLGQLIAGLVQRLGQNEATTVLEKRYPASLVVFLVAQGIYGYREGDYWSGVAAITRIDNNVAQRWGRIFEDLLRRWGKPLFPTLEGRRYVDRILIHGGIPDYCLPDFFTHMLTPAVTRPDQAMLDLDELIFEWLYATSRRYMTDKPVLRFLEHGGSIANDFVARCLDMASRHLETGVVPAPDEVGLPARVVAKYAEWATQRDAAVSRRAPQLQLARPQIWLDPYGDGVLLDLPPQLLPAGDTPPDCCWSLTIGGRTIRYSVHTVRCSDGWEAEPERLSLDEVADEYIVCFEDGRELRRVWRFSGVGSVPLLVFEPDDGRLISWRDSLPNRELWLVYPATQHLTIDRGELRETAAGLPGAWAGYRAARWDLSSAAVLMLGDRTIPVEPDATALRPWLDGGKLFSGELKRAQPALYIGEPPDIVVPLPGQRDPSAEVKRWHLSIRDDHGAVRVSAPLVQLANAITHAPGVLRLSLQRIGLGTGAFGSFTIAMRGPLGRDATFRIALVPSLRITGHERVRVPDERGRYPDVELVVETDPHLRVVCDNPAVQAVTPRPGVTALAVPAAHTEIELRLVNDSTALPVCVPLPVLRWSLGDEGSTFHASSQLFTRPEAWLDQARSARLIVAIAPHAYVPRELTGCLHVYFSSDSSPQTLRARGGSKQRWMQFHLAEAADSIRASADPSALFELVLDRLDGYESPVEVPVLRISKALCVEQVTCQGMYRDEQCYLLLRWRGGQQLRHRRLLLWSLWRPWAPPVELPIPDAAMGEQRWIVAAETLPPGAYRAEMTVIDPWSSREPPRPFDRSPGTVDIVLGRRAEQLLYLRRLPETLQGALERLLAVEYEAELSEHLSRLPVAQTDKDIIAVLSTFLTVCQRFEIADRLARGQWEPLEHFRRVCAASSAQLLTALATYCASLDQRGQTLVEDALQFIAPELGEVFFRGLRERAIAAEELRRVVGDLDEDTQATVFAILSGAGIQVREPDALEPETSAHGISSLAEIYESIPEPQITDGLRQYLREIGQFPLLRADQELDLGARIADGKEAAEELKHTTDFIRIRTLQRRVEAAEAAREMLINCNLRLVVSIAKKYTYRRMPLQDLIQEGNLGLLRAVERFDASRGYKFSTYATWWIRQAITRGIADRARIVRLPAHLIEKIGRLRRTRDQLSLTLGRDPTDEELAQALSEPLEKVRRYLSLAEETVSLETPVGEDGDSTLGDFIEAPDALDVAETVNQQLLGEQIGLVMDKLTDRERRVLMLRFGVEDGHERTLEEVGREFGVTRERIRQIEVKALRKLRHPRISQKLRDYL